MGQKNEWFIVGAAACGTLLGATLGAFISYLLTDKSTRDISKNNIISDSLKFVFKTNDIISNLIDKKEQSLDSKEKSPGVSSKLHSKFLKDKCEELKEWYMSEKNMHIYQLQRLKNQELTEKFESLFDSQHTLIAMLLSDTLLTEIEKERALYRKLVGQLVPDCTEICKV